MPRVPWGVFSIAGRGPAGKPDGRRARGNKGKQAQAVFFAESADQPHLPEVRDWPAATRDWWISWGIHPMAEEFTESDWQFLLDTALLHAAVWGDHQLSFLPELRLRVAKYGVTPEDRARLRIQFADANAKDSRSTSKPAESGAPDDEVKAEAAGSSARSRYSRKHLTAVEEESA